MVGNVGLSRKTHDSASERNTLREKTKARKQKGKREKQPIHLPSFDKHAEGRDDPFNFLFPSPGERCAQRVEKQSTKD